MNRARRSPAERRAEAVRLAEAATSMPIDEAMRHIAPRARIVASYHLAGWSLRQIASAPGPARIVDRPRSQVLVRGRERARESGVRQGIVLDSAPPACVYCAHAAQKERSTMKRILLAAGIAGVAVAACAEASPVFRGQKAR